VLLQTMNENTLCPPWGLYGGGNSGVSQTVVWEGTAREQSLTGRVYLYGPLMKGDRVSARSTGGGGWGNPSERDPLRIREDIRNGFLTAEQARDWYGFED
jgi:N-methylhydantoinase B